MRMHRTGGPLVHRPWLNPLSHVSQGFCSDFLFFFPSFRITACFNDLILSLLLVYLRIRKTQVDTHREPLQLSGVLSEQHSTLWYDVVWNLAVLDYMDAPICLLSPHMASAGFCQGPSALQHGLEPLRTTTELSSFTYHLSVISILYYLMFYVLKIIFYVFCMDFLYFRHQVLLYLVCKWKEDYYSHRIKKNSYFSNCLYI